MLMQCRLEFFQYVEMDCAMAMHTIIHSIEEWQAPPKIFCFESTHSPDSLHGIATPCVGISVKACGACVSANAEILRSISSSLHHYYYIYGNQTIARWDAHNVHINRIKFASTQFASPNSVRQLHIHTYTFEHSKMLLSWRTIYLVNGAHWNLFNILFVHNFLFIYSERIVILIA